jgi:hypothetical protein
LFLAGYLTARAAGWWANGISDLEYMQRIPEAAHYEHPR